ncbi:hypothetical protein B0H13DRAFT_2687328 [Mycena leptocephala]|nr:hypothetical protein B0H13DRAFT_2687328 [Mycena leptocephala]
MFKTYDPDEVPDVMPFPELAVVKTTKGEEIAVPKLNEYQRSWILDVGVRDEDLVSLKKKDAADFYDRIKDDAFEAKAFQHTPQPQDATEESRLPALVAAWKQKRAKKNTNSADDGDASEEEEDEGDAELSCGDTPRPDGNCNKRTAQKGKINIKTKQEGGESTPEAPALAKLFGLTASTGRDKFRLDRHDDIQEYSKTLTGAMNAGGKFRHAEALMWAKEDQASWEAAATAEEDVDWVERQQLVASGFKHMVDSLHASWKFRPFVATMLMAWLNTEGRLFKDTVNSMYEWAEKPLKDYLATREGGVKAVTPLFPLSAEALDDISVKKLAHTVTGFLAESYEAAFGSQDIPWADIAREPHNYYDTAQLPHGFPDTGLAALTRTEFLPPAGSSFVTNAALTVASSSNATPGSSSNADPTSASSSNTTPGSSSNADPTSASSSNTTSASASSSNTTSASSSNTTSASSSNTTSSSSSNADPTSASSSNTTSASSSNAAAPTSASASDSTPAQESGGSEARRTARTRKTPAEAQLEREKAAAAAVTAGKVKPSYEYILVPRSPAKPKRQRATST